MTDYRIILTVAGKQALSAFAAGGQPLTLSHVALGDASNTPYQPSENQTALVHEVYRMPVASVSSVAGGAVLITANLPANSPDIFNRPSWGWNVHELGVFASDGTLIAVARMNGGAKPMPAEGQVDDTTLQIKIQVGNTSAITMIVNVSNAMTLDRVLRAPFIAVDGVLNAPGPNPTAGATVLVGTAPTGTFTGWANKLAQYSGADWQAKDVPVGHLVVDNSQAENATGRYRRRTATGWTTANASETAYGVIRLASQDEVDNGTSTVSAVTPATLHGLTQGDPTALALRASLGISDGVMPGFPAMWTGPTPPTGWLVRDGSAISRAAYPELFAAIGTRYGAGNGTTTFNLPDDKGVFERGWDSSGSIDPGRVFGSIQLDEIKSHSHPPASGVQYFLGETTGGGGEGVVTGSVDLVVMSATGATGGTETRPRNRAYLPIIKY